MTAELSRSDVATSRRGFMAGFARLGLGSTLLPGVLWAQMSAASASTVTVAMLQDAARLSGLEFSDEEREKIVASVTANLNRIVALHEIEIPNDVAPPFYFSPLTPGMKVSRTAVPFRPSKPRRVPRPADLEHAAFWPVTELAELVRTRAVTSVELTQMYLARLHRHNEKLNCVVTFLDDVRPRAGEARRRRDRGRPLPGPAARHPVGREGHHGVRRATRPLGARAPTRIRCSTRRRP